VSEWLFMSRTTLAERRKAMYPVTIPINTGVNEQQKA
jgi:hypothetical protein